MWDRSRRSADPSTGRSAARPAGHAGRGSRRTRRLLTIGLSLGAVVATGAAANAAGNGDGFFAPGARPATARPLAAQTAGTWAVPGGVPAASAWAYAAGDGRVTDDLHLAQCRTWAPRWTPSHYVDHDGDGRGWERTDRVTRWMGEGDGDDDADDAPATWFTKRWWTGHKIALKPFATRADPSFTQVLGINDTGVAVGYSGSGADPAHPNKGFVARSPYRQRDVVARNVPGSLQTQEIGIDAAGVQVGFSVGKDGVTSGFVRNGAWVRLVRNPAGTAKPAVDQLLGVNDRGVAAGFFNDAAGHSHPYLYNVCTRSFLDVQLPVPHESAQATGVNDRGVVSGFYVSGTVTRGFLLDHGRFSVIDLGAHTNTQVLGIDAAGDVVGSFADAKGLLHGFLWSRGHVRTVDAPHATGGTVVNGLNGRGQLVGFFTTGDKKTIGFVAS